MNNSDKRQLNSTTNFVETQEAKREDWHDRLHMIEPEHDPVPVYSCGKLQFTLWPDDYGQEATL